MNSRGVSLLLMAVNFGLLGVVVYMVYTMEFGSPGDRVTRQTEVVTNSVTQITVRKVNSTNLLALVNKLVTSWNSLESTNYRTYMVNLRSFGCPEETIKDIIITDIAKLFARRRAELWSEVQPFKFWETADLATGNVPVAPELQEQLAELDREQRELVRRLLGVDLRTELARYLGQVDYVAQSYDFLPEEKRQSAELVTLEHDELEDEIYRRSKGLLLSEDRAELRRLREERRVAFEAILTPEELQEYDLRYSDTAKNMRADLAGFEPTEEEFREIFRLRSAYDSSFAAVLDSDDDAALEAQAAGFFALSSELVEVLGKERAAEYQRVQDSDYLTLLQLGERFEASPDIARSVYNMKLAAEQFKVQIESNPNLTVEQRLRTAAALARETERSVAATMGEEIFDEYRETGGRWLANLPAIDENAAPPPPQQTGTVLPYDINLLPPDLRNYLLNPPVFGPPPLPPR